METVSDLIKDKSFQKWTRGLASAEEAAYWDHWIKQSDHHRRMALDAQKIILGFTLEKRSGSGAAKSWASLEGKLAELPPATDVSRRPSIAFQEPKQSFYKLSRFGSLARVAAILLLLFSGGLLWSQLSDTAGSEEVFEPQEEWVYQTIETAYGEQKELQLFDGSQIILNANSSIRYGRIMNNNNQIHIELNGEAYFSISSRGHSNFDEVNDTFQVFTKDGVVRVLGTQFSVSSYDDRTVVVLEEGTVSIATRDLSGGDNPQEEEQWILYPNELAEFSLDSAGLIRKEVVNASAYTSWKGPRLHFDNIPVREIIKRFEYTFGIPFIIRDTNLLDRTVSGSVENSELEVMAQIFAEILDVSVDVSEERVLINNL